MTYVETGSEIQLAEYLYKYEEMVRYILEEKSFASVDSERTKVLLQAELRKAETSWYEYYSSNYRAPDYSYLQQQVTDFGVYRLDLFDCRDEKLTVDNFVYYYIELLKSEKLLSGQVFSNQDVQFIEKYERDQAQKYFEEHDQYLRGYENDRISVNETMQRLGYQQLKNHFVEDPLIRSYQIVSDRIL
ncbi:hypothetical protein [Enterococcus sp. AZ196]|uniref:hypothetical protein n=1 Tax=Enterococcus sp. AZ196 TaxID=2774659 RepID=UPI003D2B039F